MPSASSSPSECRNAQLQLEMAARGCVSGTLREWPALKEAFLLCNWMCSNYMCATEMRSLAQRCLKENFKEE